MSLSKEIPQNTNLKHVVIIPDGNGRWAEKRGLPIWEGHLAGAKRVMTLADIILDRMDRFGIEAVTFWGFSTENWSRSEEEVGRIMETTGQLLDTKASIFLEKGVQFRHIGRKDRIPSYLIEQINQLELATEQNTGKAFILALDYGGRDEIIRAVNKLSGQIIDEQSFKDLLDTSGLPDPDLVIRTAGEMRTSGIYPYQSTYAEFVSSPVLFPDFDEKELDRCLAEYFNRQRRFGSRIRDAQYKPFSWLSLNDYTYDEYLQQLKPFLDIAVGDFISEWKGARDYRGSKALQQDIDIYARLLAGGKKIRASLIVLGFENFGGEDVFRKGLLTAAIGYEVLHNSFLIHDDIEDNAATRRNMPSAHIQYKRGFVRLDNRRASERYGVSLAINTGSLGPVKSQEVLWSINNRMDRIMPAQKLMVGVVETTLQGQRHDLQDMPLDQLTEQYVYRIYFQKTAFYTVIAPFTLGATLAGTTDENLKYVRAFGANLGLAFQLVDDDLDMYGSAEEIGKPVGSDLSEAKKTLYFTKAWERATNTQRRILEQTWGVKRLRREQVDEVRSLLVDLGIRDDVQAKVANLAQKAKSFIPRIALHEEVEELLTSLCDFVILRRV